MSQLQSANADNPYRPPQRSDQEESHDAETDHRFRSRVIPATLLWIISPLFFLGLLVPLFMILFFNIRYRWIEPDLEFLAYFNQLVICPPAVAFWAFGIGGSICGMISARAWMQGRWRRAATLTISFLLLIATASYILAKFG